MTARILREALQQLQAGEMLSPMANCILRQVAASDLVLADETPIRQQSQASKGYFWVFSNELLSAYVYSPNRSGETPKKVLGNSRGDLVVDGFTGYNHVTTPDKRRRSGCNSHARRKFCECIFRHHSGADSDNTWAPIPAHLGTYSEELGTFSVPLGHPFRWDLGAAPV